MFPAERGRLVSSTCGRGDSIICQLPTGTQRAAFLLLHWVLVHFWLRCSKASKKRLNSFLFSKKTQLLVSLLTPYLSVVWVYLFIYLFFALFSLPLLPLAFKFSYKKFLSINSNYPPLLPMNQSFGYPTRFSKPSKQLWLRCWPRFTVLLKQYVALCLGFLRIGLWMHSQFSHSLFSQVCMPVCYKCYMAGHWSLLIPYRPHALLNSILDLCDLCLIIIVGLV